MKLRMFFASLLAGLLICMFSPPPVYAHPANTKESIQKMYPVTQGAYVAELQSNFEVSAGIIPAPVIHRQVEYSDKSLTGFIDNKRRDFAVLRSVPLRSSLYRPTVDRYYQRLSLAV
jgi:hypothetical protein